MSRKNTSFKFKNTGKDTTLFELKLSDKTVKELSVNAHFTVNQKQRTIESPLFGTMFPNKTAVQTITWNGCSCKLCNRPESFMVKNDTLYCVNCYSMLFGNEFSSVDHSIFENTSTPSFNLATNVVEEDIPVVEEVKKAKNKKPDHKGHGAAVLEMLETVEEVTPQPSRVAKFEKFMRKSEEKQKELTKVKKEVVPVQKVEEKQEVNMKQLYNTSCFNDILSQIAEFEERINKLHKHYHFDLLGTKNMLNVTRDSIKGFYFGFNIPSTETSTKRIIEMIIKKRPKHSKSLNSFLKVAEKVDYYMDEFGAKESSSLEEYIDVLFAHEHECQSCNVGLNKNNYHNHVQKAPMTFANALRITKVCDKCQSQYESKSLLEMVAEKVLKGEKTKGKFGIVAQIHLVTQYNYLNKKCNTIMESEAYKEIQRDFHVFYSMYISKLFQSLGLRDNQYFKENLMNILFIKEIMKDLKQQIA